MIDCYTIKGLLHKYLEILCLVRCIMLLKGCAIIHPTWHSVSKYLCNNPAIRHPENQDKPFPSIISLSP